jgi:hypothetical protein
MRYPRHIFALLLTATSVLTCDLQDRPAKLTIKATSSNGYPISGAQIVLNDETIGQTNGFGTFESTLSLSRTTKHKISITREDDKYYYAPHIEVFDLDDKPTTQINITAAMYTAPKPRILSTSITGVKSTSNLIAESPPVLPPTKNRLEDDILPLLSILNAQKITHRPIERSQPNDSHIFTTHIYAGRFPVSNAVVTFIRDEHTATKCESNERGRCVISVQYKLPAAGVLLVQREGYKSYLEKISVTENMNHRVNLDLGVSLDVIATQSSPFSSRQTSDISIQLKHQNKLLKTVKPNLAGIVSTSLDGEFPFEVVVHHEPTHSSQRFTIKSKKDAQISVRFSDGSTSGWQQWFILPIHTTIDIINDGDPIDFDRLEKILERKPEPLVSLEKKVENVFDIPTGSLALMPVIRRGHESLEFGLIAHDSAGYVSQSQFSQISLTSQTEDYWLKQFDKARNSLFRKIPWPGTVKRIKGDDLEIAINTEFIENSDTLVLSTNHGEAPLKIKNIGRNSLTANIISRVITSENIPTLIGSRVTKSLHNKPTDHNVADINNLVSLRLETKTRRLARKLLAEGNSSAAERSLLSESPQNEISIENLQLAAEIANASGDKARVLQILRQMQKVSVKTGREEFLPFIETNVNLIYTLMLPTIQNDSSMAEKFREIESQAIKLKDSLSFLEENSTEHLTLSFVILTAKQKAAECAGDILTIATLDQSWAQFESILDRSHLTMLENWRAIATKHRRKTSLHDSSSSRAL